MNIIQQIVNYFPGNKNVIHSRTFSFLQFVHFASYLFCYCASIYKLIYDYAIGCNFKADMDKNYIIQKCYSGDGGKLLIYQVCIQQHCDCD